MKYSAAEIKCPVGLLLFRGGLSTLRRPRTQYLSAMGPMRSLFEVWAIAGIIYRLPDTSIKPMQFTDVTSFASWWCHRLLSVFTFSFITLTNLGQFSSPIPVFESVLNLCDQLFDFVWFWYQYDKEQIQFWGKFKQFFFRQIFLDGNFKIALTSLFFH